MDSSRRKLAVWAIVCFVIGAAGVALAITGTVPVSDGVSLQSPDGMNATLLGATDAQLETPFPTSGTVEWTTEAGNISFFSTGPAAATVAVGNITGTWTNVTHIDADPNTITITPDDKAAIVVGQEINSIAFRQSYTLGDGTVDFVYAGTTGQSRVTLSGVPVNQEIVAVDAATGNFLDLATSDGSGVITFDALTNSEHAVLLQAADFASPTLSDPVPTGDLSSNPGSISIAVNDSDFDQGDRVAVTVSLDGSQIHSETISANQTVSVSMPQSGQTGGSHQWTVTANPTYGDTSTTTYSYRVPATLTVRSERDHSEILNMSITSNVTFYGNGTIVRRQTNDGTVNMTGLPVNQDFIVEVVPSNKNWTTRALYLESIYQQQSVYLLNTSAVETTDTRFRLNDPTGQFGPQSIVFIQRPISINNTTQWQTIHADSFGVEGVTATLQKDQRYRIRIQNAQGTEQIIGPYRADVSETVTVEPGAPGIDLENFERGYSANAVLKNTTLTYAYEDPTGDTDEVTVWIHERGNKSNRLVANTSYFDVGAFSAKETLTANESEKTWVVNFVVDRGDEQFIKSITVSNRKNLFGAVPQPWRAMIGIGLLLLLAGAFSQLNAAIGGVVVAAVGGILYFIGLLSGMTTGIGVTLAVFVAVLNQIRLSRGP